MNTALIVEDLQTSMRLDERTATRIIRDRDGFAALQSAWQELGDSAGGPIEQYEWIDACLRTVRSPRRLNMVLIERNDDLLAVAPLALKSVNGVSRSVMIGVDEHHEPMELLAADMQSLLVLVAALASQRRPFLFDRMPDDAPCAALLKNVLGRRALVLTRSQQAYPYIPLDDSWIQPEQNLNSRRRSDLRRAKRRAEKLGEVRTEILTPRPEELDRLLDEAIAVEARSWKGIEGTALAFAKEDSDFCREYARQACDSGVLRICFLRINGTAVATQIAMVKGGGFWLLKIGYDAEYRQCSPGILLLRDVIAHAAEVGLASFEFLGQSEPWIKVWTSHQRDCSGIRVYPYNILGAAALIADLSVKGCEAAKDKACHVVSGAKQAAKRLTAPLMRRASRNYIAGDNVEDAARVKQQLSTKGLHATIGFWDTEQDSAEAVATRYAAGLDVLADDGPKNYLSIKLPSLRYSSELLRELAKKAVATNRLIHFDGMAPDTVEKTQGMIDELRLAVPETSLGCTLPGRWKRSLEDASWARERELFVRVVKGEWPDPVDRGRDMTAGFLEVIDQLAGGPCRVAVATHNPALLREAVRRLQAAGTACEAELLYGLPMKDALTAARQLGVDARVYVPYGEAYMPYALSQLRRKPRILWWLARDLFLSSFELPKPRRR